MRQLLNFLCLMCFLSLPGFAQEEEEASSSAGRVIIRESIPAPSDPETEPSDTIDQEDKELAELERKQAEYQKKMQMIEKSAETLAKPLGANPVQQLLELTQGQINTAALLDDKVQAALTRLFSEGHTLRGTREDTLKMLKEKVAGGMGEKIFNWFPGLSEILVDLIRDTQAIPGLLRILARKEDLKSFGYIWLAMFIFVILIKGRVVKAKWPFWKRRLVGLCFRLPFWLLSIWIFYSMFSEELRPTLTIIARHYT